MARRAWYGRRPDVQRHLSRPVISVGNLRVGGSGKTPVVAALATLLRAVGERPSVLSRGYARRTAADGVTVVSDGTRVLASVDESGDEPQMLALQLAGVPVLVCPDRYLAGVLAERQFGCSVHLLDDGFQHVTLHRTVDLLLVSQADWQDAPMPAGRLREPLHAAVLADAWLVPDGEPDVPPLSSSPSPRVFRVRTQAHVARDVRTREPLSLVPGRAVAVAAIAAPERFFATAREQGWEVVREMAFRDHHWFDRADLTAVAGALRDSHAEVVLTTEKDAVRMEPVLDRCNELASVPIACLPISVSVEPEADFRAWLTDALAVERART